MLYWNNKASLVVKDTEPSDSAKYRCEVSNRLGRVETSGSLTVYSKYSTHSCHTGFVLCSHCVFVYRQTSTGLRLQTEGSH